MVVAWDACAFVFLIFWTWGPWFPTASRDFIAPKEITLAFVVVLTAGAVAIYIWGNTSVLSSYSYRAATWLWTAWTRWVERTPGVALLAAGTAMAILWAVSALRRHWALGSNVWDLSIYTNALWNLTHGHGYVSSVKQGSHLFADHQTPTFWLLAPLFAAWPAPELLLIVQAVAYVTSGAALFYISRQYGGARWLAAATPLLFWCYLPTRNANAFDARPDSFMVPLFLWSIAGMQSTSTAARISSCVALLLALGCKETAAIVGAAVAVAWIGGAAPPETRRFCRMVGVCLLAFAVGLFYIDVRLLPRLVGGSYAYSSLYAHYGESIRDVALAPILEPRTFLWQVTQPAALEYLFWTLAPLGWIPMLDWCGWLVATPGYLMLFLVNTPYRVNTVFQYSNEIVVGLLWATARTLPMLAQMLPRALPLWLAAWTLAGAGGSEILRVRHYSPDPHAQWVRQRLVRAIDRRLSLATSDAIAPHLSTRYWIQNLMHLRDANGEPIACIVTDPAVSNLPLSQSEVRAIADGAVAAGYRIEYQCGSVQVLAWGTNKCLVTPVACG